MLLSDKKKRKSLFDFFIVNKFIHVNIARLAYWTRSIFDYIGKNDSNKPPFRKNKIIERTVNILKTFLNASPSKSGITIQI